jgi:hypothetical protein
LFVLVNGRVAGVSGIVAGVIARSGAERAWQLAFVVGMMAAPLLWRAARGLPALDIDAGWGTLVIAGLLVGIGTRYGGGCTSGHGVCGVARLSPRSLTATLAFMIAGIATVYVVRHLIGA